MRISFLTGVIAGLLLTAWVRAQPVIQDATEYYEFSAATRAEIWHQILANSPKGSVEMAGHHAVNVATTEWRFEGHYRYEASLFKCRIIDVQPVLYITIHLPHWNNKWQADAKLAEDWDRYVRMVSNHEAIHRRYAIKMAEEYEKTLNELDTYKSCRDLNDDVTKIKDRLIGKYRAKNLWFDAQEFEYQKELNWF